jgi:type II secretory pathway component PulL
MTVVGIGEIAFHHSHTSLLKHTARSTSRQSKAKDDGGFWSPVRVSILIIFSPLQSNIVQAHSIPLRAKGPGKRGGMTAERVIGY